MLKTVVLATALVCAFSINANARPHHKHHNELSAHAWCGALPEPVFRQIGNNLRSDEAQRDLKNFSISDEFLSCMPRQ